MSPCCSFTCNYVLCINDFWCVYSEVVDKAGVDPLITLLNDAKPLVQANAAVCLTNLATEGILVTLPQTNKPWHGFRAFCPALGIWWFFFARLAFSRAWWYLYFTFPAFGTGWGRVHVFVQQRRALCAGKQWFTSLLTFVLIGQM